MFKHLVIISSLGLLAACAYVVEREYQPVTIRTTGAKDTMCEVWAAKIRYKYYPPQTRNLKNDLNDLVIKCYAPGNRYREVIIEPRIAGATYANVLNGVIPGVTVDYTSGAMFVYPDTIDIDFTHMPYGTMPLPAHDNTDIMDPRKYYLEDFRPNQPGLNEDRFYKEQPLLRRSSPGMANDDYSQSSVNEGKLSTAGEKGELSRVLDSLSGSEAAPVTDQQASPQVDVPPLFPDEPLPLFPVE